MNFIRSFSNSFIVTAVILLGLYVGTANAASPTVSNIYVSLLGEVTLPNGDTVLLSGRVHILSRVTFSDAFVPTVNLYVNLIGVEGTSDTTGKHYLVVGASNVEWVGVSPGPPDIPEQTFNFSLVETNPGPPETNPGPPDLPPSPVLPVFLRDFVFAKEAGSEGSLQGVVASFLSD
ncbi:MAG TPA: hypothetical protein VGQ39_01280 [Pyrinomonadaceae bacterium]|jgi:hypothetical protein|nr:hypothetical protein [Pyrinomonadaceae bacterium]